MSIRRSIILIAAVLLATATSAHARIGLVVGEPFGSFGTMMPVGHAGIYLDHLCAETPLQLRPCRPGELGVVLSRYHDLKTTQLDWMATPASVFFYGVDDPANTPTSMTLPQETELREAYRQTHLLDIAPNRIDKRGNMQPPKPGGDWAESIGATFDRRLYLYTIATTPEQDSRLLTLLNNDPNHRSYKLGRANCADFAANMLRIVLPGQLPRNFFADFDMTTPKNLTRDLDTYGHAHPELDLRVYELPQIPGTLRRSRPLRGCAEGFVKTKRYLFTLILIQPEFVLADTIAYVAKGRWSPGLDAKVLTPTGWPIHSQLENSRLETEQDQPYSPASTSSRIFSEGIGFRAK